jgi:hypothetical protein
VLITKYYSNDRVEKNEMDGACSTERKGAYRVLVVKRERKRQLERTRHKLEDSIETSTGTGSGDRKWVGGQELN